jgi:multiple sugar transport system substrate-binding protein
MRQPTVFLFLALISILFSSCQPAVGGTISFMVFGDPAELAAYQTLVDSFSEKYLSIQVELIHIPGQAEYRNRIAADLIAGNPADVLLINYRRYAAFASIGALEPLDGYLENSRLLKKRDFYPEAIEPFVWNGQLMCIPQNISSLVVYYNKDLFDQAGVPYPAEDWTWLDFLSAAQALTKDFDHDGTRDQFGAGVEPSLMRLAPFIWQAGGHLVDDRTNPSTLVLDQEGEIRAERFFVGLQTVYHVVPNAEQEAAEDSESRFINGRLAMFFNSRRGVPTYRESISFDWDVAPLPRADFEVNILHADGYCLPSASQNKEAAWKFIEFANSVEGQTIIARTGRTVPSLISVADSPAFLDPEAKPASSHVFLDAIPTIRALPVHPHWAEIEEITSEELALAFYGEVGVQEAMQRANLRTREYFE